MISRYHVAKKFQAMSFSVNTKPVVLVSMSNLYNEHRRKMLMSVRRLTTTCAAVLISSMLVDIVQAIFLLPFFMDVAKKISGYVKRRRPHF